MEIIKASLDRFEEDLAVVYSDTDDRKFTLPKDMVQAEPGSRLVLYMEGETVTKVEIDESATKAARDRIKEKYRRLISGKRKED